MFKMFFLAIKIVFFFFFFLLVRSSVPRHKIFNFITFFWKFLIPYTFTYLFFFLIYMLFFF